MFLLFSWCSYSMEEWKEDPKRLGYSFVHILPSEILEKIIVITIDESKDIEEAALSLTKVRYIDKETYQFFSEFLPSSKPIRKKLIEKYKKSNMPWFYPEEIIKKLLYPTTKVPNQTFSHAIHKPGNVKDSYVYRYPCMARFYYAYFLVQGAKGEFLQDALSIPDIKTVVYCLNHGEDVNAVYYRNFLGDEYTGLALGIEKENTGLVQILLAHGANPDQRFAYSNKRGMNGYYVEEYATPRELADRKGNQAILKLLENHSQVLTKE